MIWLTTLTTFLMAAPINDNQLSNQDTVFSEKIEAQVGKQIITTTDIQLEINQLRKQYSKDIPNDEYRRRAFERRMEVALAIEYLKRLQMNVDDQEVERRVHAIRAAQGISDLDEFRSLLESQGMSFESFKKQVKEQMQLSQFNQILQRQVLQTTDEKELKAYYQNHAQDFSTNPEVTLQECFIPIVGSPEQTMKIAQPFINKPASFGKCVEKYSQSPSRQNDGMLGKVQMGTFRAEVEKIVFNTKPGKVAKIELPGAIQLIRVVSKKDLGPRSFESAKDEIQNLIQGERISQAREKLMADLRATTYIKLNSQL